MTKYVTNTPPKEPEVQVSLEENEDGVSIKVGRWYVAVIRNDGYMGLFGSVGNDEGLVTHKGYIKVLDETDLSRAGYTL